MLPSYLYIHPWYMLFYRRKYQLVQQKFERFSVVAVAKWLVAWSLQEKLFKIAMFGYFVKGEKYMWVHLIPWEGWKKLLRRYTKSSNIPTAVHFLVNNTLIEERQFTLYWNMFSLAWTINKLLPEQGKRYYLSITLLCSHAPLPGE